MLEEVVVSWQEVTWIWRTRQNSITRAIQLLKHWLCNRQWGNGHGEPDPFYWPRPAAGTWSMSSICWAYFLDVMVSPEFRKLQWLRTSADPQTVTVTFFWCKFGFGKYFGASSWFNHWVGGCWSLDKIYFSSHITIQSRNGSLLLQNKRRQHMKITIFFLSQLTRHPLIKLFHLSNLPQVHND